MTKKQRKKTPLHKKIRVAIFNWLGAGYITLIIPEFEEEYKFSAKNGKNWYKSTKKPNGWKFSK